MKRNYLLLVGALFLSTVAITAASTHVFDERHKKPEATHARVERTLPRLPHLTP